VVDGGGLENHCTRKGTGGSNPSLSVSLLRAIPDEEALVFGDDVVDQAFDLVVLRRLILRRVPHQEIRIEADHRLRPNRLPK
jgi:hypothetical protein